MVAVENVLSPFITFRAYGAVELVRNVATR